MIPHPFSIAVLLPVYNENPETLQRIMEDLQLLAYQIIVIDDGSSIPVKIHLENLIVLRHRINLGQGAALETGMEFARTKNFDIVVHMDADGQHQVAEIQHLLNPIIAEEADIVFGSRFLSSSSAGMIPASRRYLLKISRIANRFFTSLQMTDAHNGFRALNRKALYSIRLQSRRREHASEIVWRAVQENLRIKEVPVHIIYPDRNEKIPLPVVVKLGFSLLWKRIRKYNTHSFVIQQERSLAISNANKWHQSIP